MNEKFTIDMPFFPGFYETTLETSDTAYYAIANELDYCREELGREDLTEDDLDFDYRAYEQDVIEHFIDAWKGHAPACVKAVEYDHLWSPKYYNFENDSLYCNVTMKEGWQDDMRAFMEKNADWLRERIKKQWSSRDGFFSFMSNNFDDTREDTEHIWEQEKSWYFHLFVEKDARYIGVMLGYMMLIDNKNVDDEIIYETLEDVCDSYYVFVKADRESEKAQGESATPATA